MRAIEEIKIPGKNMKTPKNIPLNKKIEYKLFKIIPIPNPFKKINKKLNNIPKNVSEIKKSNKIDTILHEIILHSIDKFLKFIILKEKILKFTSHWDSEQPIAIPM